MHSCMCWWERYCGKCGALCFMRALCVFSGAASLAPLKPLLGSICGAIFRCRWCRISQTQLKSCEVCFRFITLFGFASARLNGDKKRMHPLNEAFVFFPRF